MKAPADKLLGAREGPAFCQLMQELPQERLIIAVNALGSTERALDDTVAYAKQREAFGQPLCAFPNTRFVLTQAQAGLPAARSLVDAAISAQLKGQLEAACAALSRCSEPIWSPVCWINVSRSSGLLDQCLPLFGDCGYILATPIAELRADARVARIYGGANEVLNELATRQL